MPQSWKFDNEVESLNFSAPKPHRKKVKAKKVTESKCYHTVFEISTVLKSKLSLEIVWMMRVSAEIIRTRHTILLWWCGSYEKCSDVCFWHSLFFLFLFYEGTIYKRSRCLLHFFLSYLFPFVSKSLQYLFFVEFAFIAIASAVKSASRLMR